MTPHAQSRGHDWPFTVAAMFTADMTAFAERLKASLELFGLNYALYRVPTVHRSISSRGSDDFNFCKPAFIERMLTRHAMPILYLDADTVVCAPPDKIKRMVSRGGADFAVYNWFADDANAAYAAIPYAGSNNRFYVFSHSINIFDPQQLCASGAVQFYTNNARPLLHAWRATIVRHPNVADDKSLDFSFNLALRRQSVRAQWLGKDYCRYAFWPHVRPVIDHPQLTHTEERHFPGERAEGSRVSRLPTRELFPRNLIFDSETKNLLRTTPAGPVVVGTFNCDFWEGVT
jgi:hypothetical protein